MSKENSWFKLKMVSPGAGEGVFFGPAEFDKEADALVPGRFIKKGATVIWIPNEDQTKSFTTCMASVCEANWNKDEEKLKRLEELGVPRGCHVRVDMSYRSPTDLSSMYTTVAKRKRVKKADSAKVMRAQFGAQFEDGARFPAGTVVKILFRKEFVKDSGGSKKFKNVYVRPDPKELDDFLASEKAGRN